jgi:hypothetical protein
LKDSKAGIGGAPTRATTLPDEPQARKEHPVASGFMDYFPDAVVAVSNISHRGNQQHNPGQPLHWARSKSTDEADTMLRHFLQRGTLDTDGVRHTAKMVWRALALLQKEIEVEQPPIKPVVWGVEVKADRRTASGCRRVYYKTIRINQRTGLGRRKEDIR